MRVEVTMSNSREETLSVEQTEDANPNYLPMKQEFVVMDVAIPKR